MESKGERLKKLRLEKGLSLEEVSKFTKISPHILKAIEDDSSTNISPVYIKGFVKIYCKFLGVDPQEYLSQYYPQTSSITTLRTAQNREEKRILIKKASKDWELLAESIRVVLIVLIIGFLGFTLFRFIHFLRQENLVKKQKRIASSIQEEVLTSKESLTRSEPIPIQVPGNGIRLVIEAKDNCWIKLSLDGKVVFQNILIKGKAETWQAKDKIELSLGNAGAVVLEVNGKVMPALGKKGQAIKNIIITPKEGLRVLH
ncbi:MAG: DUF4115 domain-containing protein [Candidatus Omnitrophica bacterium]|nr:DUF4115 domain-containing protein [Candidatus Omnitrophota bacterium]